MNVLTLDTALGACSVAVGTNQSILAARFEERQTGHAEALLPMIAHVLNTAGLRPASLGRIGVTVGPGSFTGTRIGLAAARALGRSLEIPVVGITTFEALRMAAPPGRSATVAFDARRGQIYVQDFDSAGTSLGEARATEAGSAAREMAGRDSADGVLMGSAAGALRDACSQFRLPVEVIEWPRWPDARIFLSLAARAPWTGHMPRPLYLRPPDVTL